MKNKISLLGIGLGLIAGAIVALLAGTWIFWLASGIAVGVILGSAGSRAARRSDVNSRGANVSGVNVGA
jgi:hypothetical protein